MDSVTLDKTVEELRLLMQEKLRLRGRSLGRLAAKAGRRLPKGVQRDVETLSAAQMQCQNPKLARMVDTSSVTAAHTRIREHLKAIDPKERRKTKMLNMLGLISFQLIFMVVVFIAYVWWRGLI